MSEAIAEKIHDDDLHRFHADFRRALLMHRKGRLNLFFHLHFPKTKAPLYEGLSAPENVDFRHWLAETPSPAVSAHGIYRELIVKQEKLSKLVQDALNDLDGSGVQPSGLAKVLRAVHEFDRVADRLDSGITTSLTDIDELTGLLNRSAMERDLDQLQAQARRTKRPLTVAMIDADHFKKVNDEHGHGFGDVVLETLAERFVESLRPSDRLYRYGGEEFLVILPDTSLEKAEPILERLRQRICQHDISDGVISVKQSVSIGFTELADDSDIRVAIDRADGSLYRAKNSGRNRLEFDKAPVSARKSAA